jgi:elongation factor G
VIDLLTKKAYKFSGHFGVDIEEIPVPEDMKEKVEKFHAELVEKAVECDEAAMEKYLNGQEVL